MIRDLLGVLLFIGYALLILLFMDMIRCGIL